MYKLSLCHVVESRPLAVVNSVLVSFLKNVGLCDVSTETWCTCPERKAFGQSKRSNRNVQWDKVVSLTIF